MGIRGVVDTGGKTADQLEREASGLEPGWFRATVIDVSEEDGNLKLTFALADQRIHTETLWDPAASVDEKAARRLEQRRAAFSVRLGLVPREAIGRFEFDWLDCINRQCILHLVMSRPNKDGKQYVQIDWMGIFAVDDTRAPAPLLEPNPKLFSMTEAAAAALKANDKSAYYSGAATEAALPLSSAPKAMQAPLSLDDL